MNNFYEHKTVQCFCFWLWRYISKNVRGNSVVCDCVGGCVCMTHSIVWSRLIQWEHNFRAMCTTKKNSAVNFTRAEIARRSPQHVLITPLSVKYCTLRQWVICLVKFSASILPGKLYYTYHPLAWRIAFTRQRGKVSTSRVDWYW